MKDFRIKDTTLAIFKEIKQNRNDYFLMLVTVQLLTLVLTWGISKGLFKLFLKISSVASLNFTNIGIVMRKPLSLIVFLLILIVVILAVYMEAAIIIYTIYGHKSDEKVCFGKILLLPFKKIPKLFNLQFFMIFLYFLVTLPFLKSIGYPSILKKLQIPNFILDELLKNPVMAVIVGLGLLYLLYLNIRMIFVLPILVVSDHKVSEAITLSRKLTKKHFFKFLLQLLVFTLIGGAVLFIAITLLTQITYLILKYNPSMLVVNLSLSLASVFTFCYIAYVKLYVYSFLVYILKENDMIDFKVSSEYLKIGEGNNHRKLVKVVLILFFIGKFALDAFNYACQDGVSHTKIVAHRGFTEEAVENTIEGLEAAARLNADYVELDVMQTKDDKLVVIHDYNLKRLAGVNVKVRDLTLEELQKIDLRQNGHVGKVPTLREFIEKSKKLNIKLMIELKPNKIVTEKFYNDLIGEIVDANIEHSAVVTSLDKNLILEVKKKLPQIKVGYISPFQFGGIEDIGVDFYVVEEMSYTQGLVAESLRKNIPIFVWTVNEEIEIKKHLVDGTYGIITDNLIAVDNFNYIMSSDDLINYYLYKMAFLE